MTKSNKYEWDYCTFSPEKIFGVYVGDPCCKQHDHNYSLEGKIEKQKNADIRLRICIAEHFLAYGHSMRLAKFISGIYYRAVRLFGWYEWKTWGYKKALTRKERWTQRLKNLNILK